VTDWNGYASNAIVVTAGQPPFPEYPSGHNCAAGAIQGSLRYWFHNWRSLSEALRENPDARAWAGIHFRQADLAGAALGRQVARYLHNHDLQRRF
jgi:hypothetical protein